MSEYERWNSNPVRRVASYLMKAGWARNEEQAIEYAARIVLNFFYENKDFQQDDDHLTPDERQELDNLIKLSTLSKGI